VAEERATLGKDILDEAAKMDALRLAEQEKRRALQASLERVEKKEAQLRAVLEGKVQRLNNELQAVQTELDDALRREKLATEKTGSSDRAAMEARMKLETERRLWEEAKAHLKANVSNLTKRAHDAEASLAAAKVQLQERALAGSRGGAAEPGAAEASEAAGGDGGRGVGDGSALAAQYEAQLAAVRGEMKVRRVQSHQCLCHVAQTESPLRLPCALMFVYAFIPYTPIHYEVKRC
jgi:hypothetical protein